MEELEKSPKSGMFSVSEGRRVYGELTLNGPKTTLYLRDSEYFSRGGVEDRHVFGVLHDLTRVSLLQCIPRSAGSAGKQDEEYHYAKVFPHFVLFGDRHLAPSEAAILQVSFFLENSSALFYDFDAFGTVLRATNLIEAVVGANQAIHGRQVRTGTNPIITYFTGKHEIISVETALGTLSARHNPTFGLGGPDGVPLENRISVALDFREPVTFDRAILDASVLVRFFELLLGGPENLLGLHLRTTAEGSNPDLLSVYWSMRPRHENRHREPHPADVLIRSVEQPEEFSRVLRNWLEREPAWRDARSRFANYFENQQRYSTDRLVGAANMFDILPDDATPPDVELSSEVKLAKEQCRSVFRQLLPSPERDSVLAALGRVGKSNLKQKVRHRAHKLVDVAGDRFPDLVTVTDEAINCRNHYVHGGPARLDYVRNSWVTFFFTDTLEFVFAASDLIDAGWDLRSWIEQGTTMSHPFGRYRVDYAANLRELKGLLAGAPDPAST